jgi:hypothetical protein
MTPLQETRGPEPRSKTTGSTWRNAWIYAPVGLVVLWGLLTHAKARLYAEEVGFYRNFRQSIVQGDFSAAYVMMDDAYQREHDLSQFTRSYSRLQDEYYEVGAFPWIQRIPSGVELVPHTTLFFQQVTGRSFIIAQKNGRYKISSHFMVYQD